MISSSQSQLSQQVPSQCMSGESELAGEAGTPKKTKSWGFLFALLWLATVVIIGIMLLRMSPNGLDGRKYIPIVVAAVPWLTIASLGILLAAMLGRRKLLSAVSILCLVAQGFWHWGFIVAADPLPDEARQIVAAQAVGTVDTSDAVARIMTLNTKNGMADADEIVRIVRKEHIEVLTLQEMTQSFIKRLQAAGIGELLPHSVVAKATGNDNGGVNGLWSAAPLSDATGNLIPIDASRVAAGTIDFAGREVRFGSVHPFSPRPSNQGLWDRGLDAIAQLSRYDHMYVLMGDFNSSWDHASFRYLLGERFLDSGQQAGEGFHMTYPANATLFDKIPLPAMVEIDHIVHDKGITVGDLATRTIPGSDHKALLGTMKVW